VKGRAERFDAGINGSVCEKAKDQQWRARKRAKCSTWASNVRSLSLSEKPNAKHSPVSNSKLETPINKNTEAHIWRILTTYREIIPIKINIVDQVQLTKRLEREVTCTKY
jgi:hypothetical protein